MNIDYPKLTKKENSILKKIQNQILSCSYDFPTGEFQIGKETDLNDLFFKFEINEKSMRKILKHIRCPRCGNREFDNCSFVGIQTDFENELDSLYEAAKKKYNKKFQEFEKYYHKPTLAFKSTLGKRIYKELKQLLPETITIKGCYFKGRPVEADLSKAFESNEMLLAPAKKVLEGRFNNNGQPHLYLAETQIGARRETCQNFMCNKDTFIQEFDIKTPAINILDLSHNFYEIALETPLIFVSLYDFISLKNRNLENYKPDYFISKFIGDCARDLGYNGILYNSAITKSQKNLVLFNIPNDLIFNGKPKFIKADIETKFQIKKIDI